MRPYECYSQSCNKLIHLYGGVGPNYIFKFHFDSQLELEVFLHRQNWTPEQIQDLTALGEVKAAQNEWARLERA